MKPATVGEWILTLLLVLLGIVFVYEMALFVIALTKQVLK